MLLSRSWLPPIPLVRGSILFRLAVLTLLPLSVLFFWVSSYVDVEAAPFSWSALTPFRGNPPLRMPIARPLKPLQNRVACTGPRGQFLSASSDDELISVSLPRSYPEPFSGSYNELNLEQSWMTADGRYGAYGWGEDRPDYNRTKVRWDAVDWGKLQNECFDRNARRFPRAATKTRFDSSHHLAWQNTTTSPPLHFWNEFSSTRRTAIVLRAYDGYNYTALDMVHIRALIVEASLRTGGEYAVILYVNIRDKEKNIFASPEAYARAFDEAGIPPELRSIAILWDDGLLSSWYPKVEQHLTFWQVNQPLQVLAHLMPHFDHYWQLEMDVRFLGDAGAFLDALHLHARAEPRKQGLERATYMFMQDRMGGSYANFSRAVDMASHGGSRAWGPVPVADITPIGPEPPVARPEEEMFQWGVGEDADALVMSVCDDVLRSDTWVFRHWAPGFSDPERAARWYCPPAIMRASRELLHALHNDQRERGLALPSEATLPSFALWHGLKVSYPPMPTFIRSQATNATEAKELRDRWYAGGPAATKDGQGHLDPQDTFGGQMSWWWSTSFPNEIMGAWLGSAGGGPAEVKDADMPYVLARHEGQIYAANVPLHSYKKPE